jgi:hypothetical protein
MHSHYNNTMIKKKEKKKIMYKQSSGILNDMGYANY